MTKRSGEEITIQTVQQVFAAASMHRLCSVIAYPSRTDVPEPGTGTLVRHRGELFVVTCEHVAKAFFGMHGGDLMFRHLPKVPRSNCSLVYSDKSLDLDAIHIHQDAGARLVSLRPLSLDDFGGDSEFHSATARSRSHYVVAGFLGALAAFGPEPHRITLNPMFVGTTVRRRRGARLELDYAHAIKDGELVAARGLSGSLVFEMQEPQGTDLWKPGVAVAVQHAWNEVKRALICSPVRPCVEAILTFCGRHERHA
jgi:hypothetical protein